MIASAKKVLFYPLHETFIEKFIQLVKSDAEDNINAVFVLTGSRLVRYIPLLLRLEIEVWRIGEGEDGFHKVSNQEYVDVGSPVNEGVGLRVKTNEPTTYGHWLRKLVERSSSLVRFKEWIYHVHNRKREVRLLIERYEIARKLIEEVRPDVAVLCGDRHLHYEPAFIRACSELLIPIKIPPVSISATPEQMARRKFKKGSGTFVSKKISKRYVNTNQYKTCSNNCYVSYYESWRMDALRQCEMLSDNPWVIGGSGKVTVLVPGPHIATKIASYGVPSDMIVVTGDTDYDHVMTGLRHKASRRESLLENGLFHSDKLFLGLSLPQHLEHKFLTHDTHWKNIELLCEALSDTGQNICLSLHPKMNFEKYRYLEQKYSLAIVREPLSHWVAALDIFSATAGSSTLLWSLLAGVPTIALDLLKLGDVIMEVDIKVVVENPHEYKNALNRLVFDSEYREELGQAQEDNVGVKKEYKNSASSSASIISEIIR